jgi:hypothetical protein
MPLSTAGWMENEAAIFGFLLVVSCPWVQRRRSRRGNAILN